MNAATAQMSQDELKKLVGYKSVDDHVTSGMVVGLGTGSTAYFAVERLGQKLKSGELKDIVAIPTSERTREQAESLGIPLCTLNEKSKLDVAIDGADEVDPDLALVKGGGGALLREKMVEVMAKKFVVIVDESKLCKGLGPGFPLPVEITPFCHEHTARTIAELPSLAGCEAVIRMGSSSTNKPDGDNIAVTDNGNYIVDLHFKEPIKDVNKAASDLKNTVGVVDHGLFVGMSYQVIVAGSDGIRVAGTDGEKAWWNGRKRAGFRERKKSYREVLIYNTSTLLRTNTRALIRNHYYLTWRVRRYSADDYIAASIILLFYYNFYVYVSLP